VRVGTARVHPSPVLVSGLPKSGKTPIATLLGKATGKSVNSDPIADIDRKRGPLRQKLFNKELAIRDLIHQNKFYFSTDIIDDPTIISYYGEFSNFFPRSRFVFVIRDPRGTIRERLNWLKLPGHLQSIDDQLLLKKGGLALDLAREGYIEAGSLPLSGDNYIERMANQWNQFVDVYFSHSDDIVMVRYEDFVDDKARAIAELATKVGLNPRFDITPHIDTQWSPGGDHDSTWEEFFGPVNLDRLETICGDRMKRLGYR